LQQIEPTPDLNQPPSSALLSTGSDPVSTASSSTARQAEVTKVAQRGLEGHRPFAILNITETMDEMQRRRALLYLMMSAIGLYIIFTLVLSWFLGLVKNSDWLGALSGLLIIVLSVGLNFWNKVRLASYIFLGGGVVGLVLRSLDDSGLVFANLIFNYFALVAFIVFAGLVLEQYAPLLVAFTGIIGFLPVFWNYGVNQHADANLLIQIFVYGAALHFSVASVVWNNARTIKRVLHRSAWQNQELLKVNQQLEQNLQRNTALSNNIGQLSSDLSHISQDQSLRAHNQAQAVAVVTSTLEELGATARQIAEVAESVVIATEQALNTAEVGGRSVGLGIDSIGNLTSQVEGINSIATELSKQSRRISEIVETITDLAEETNLLALNATIEAAGAGEYGRRFAVVASEVQTLAARSRAASRDVQVILGQIRNSIESTLRATEGGLEEAHRMGEVASQAGEAISQIIDTVESTTYLARQINLTTQQQRSATDQAVEMVRRVAGDSRDAAAHAQQLLEVSNNLSQTASHLRQD
jgi:methyl-accepting chemotaxis protein